MLYTTLNMVSGKGRIEIWIDKYIYQSVCHTVIKWTWQKNQAEKDPNPGKIPFWKAYLHPLQSPNLFPPFLQYQDGCLGYMRQSQMIQDFPGDSCSAQEVMGEREGGREGGRVDV